MALNEDQLSQASRVLQAMREQIGNAMVGQTAVVEQVLVALVAGGHVLIEGVPGLGKTLLVRALAKTFDGSFGRIQFTPDLMPADVTGHTIYDPSSGQFSTRKGPVFTNLLLADEINRAPAKTQAALLEVMQEAQVTIEGTPHMLPQPFMVLATQNPVEQEGTYPLPEAQLDRFLLKVRIDYPQHAEEVALTRAVTLGKSGDSSPWTRCRPWSSPPPLPACSTTAPMSMSTTRCSTTPCAWRARPASSRAFPPAPARVAASRWCVPRAVTHCSRAAPT